MSTWHEHLGNIMVTLTLTPIRGICFACANGILLIWSEIKVWHRCKTMPVCTVDIVCAYSSIIIFHISDLSWSYALWPGLYSTMQLHAYFLSNHYVRKHLRNGAEIQPCVVNAVIFLSLSKAMAVLAHVLQPSVIRGGFGWDLIKLMSALIGFMTLRG